MRFLVFSAVCMAAAVATVPAFMSEASSYGFHVTPDAATFNALLAKYSTPLTGTESMPEIRRSLLQAVMKFGKEFLTHPERTPVVAKYLSKHFPADYTPSHDEVVSKFLHLVTTEHAEDILAADGRPTLGNDQFPYFGFIPPLRAAALMDGPEVTFTTKCWKTVKAVFGSNADGSGTVNVTVADRQELMCSTHFLLGTVESLRLGVEISESGTHSFEWKASPSRTAAELWDLKNKGVRFYEFPDGAIDTIIQIVETALLFQPEIVNPVTTAAAERNVYFMKYYANAPMEVRNTTVVTIDESTVQSGDFFGIIRLDGLDPMLGWAMGSTTGHTTIALRDEVTNELYITESTVKDDYWPTNGIQKTPYKQWVQQAIEASYQVVHAPLSAEAAAKFNLTKAWAWFNRTQGLDYGYHNMLWGWIDTLKDNYPCTPPDFSSQCLEWSHVEVLFSVINKFVPAVGELLFMQAWNLRLGTVDLPPAELYYLASQKGMEANEIPVIVENDSWMYNMTRYGKPSKGPSSVCCVHVCRTWKAAGLFDDFNSEINCAEQTNWDDYALTILDPHPKRPQQCIDADPTNTLCQLTGKYTLNLNNYSTKKPFAHIGEKCPSEAPHYVKPADC